MQQQNDNGDNGSFFLINELSAETQKKVYEYYEFFKSIPRPMVFSAEACGVSNEMLVEYRYAISSYAEKWILRSSQSWEINQYEAGFVYNWKRFLRKDMPRPSESELNDIFVHIANTIESWEFSLYHEYQNTMIRILDRSICARVCAMKKRPQEVWGSSVERYAMMAVLFEEAIEDFEFLEYTRTLWKDAITYALEYFTPNAVTDCIYHIKRGMLLDGLWYSVFFDTMSCAREFLDDNKDTLAFQTANASITNYSQSSVAE